MRTRRFTTVAAFFIFALVKATIGLRVNVDEELEGLDAGEHAMHAYDFLSSFGRRTGVSRDTASYQGPRMGTSPAE